MSTKSIHDAEGYFRPVVLLFFLLGAVFLYFAAKGIWKTGTFKYEHRNEIKVMAEVTVVNFADEGYDEHLCLIYSVDGQEYTKIVDNEEPSLFGRSSQIIYVDPEDYDIVYWYEQSEDTSIFYFVLAVAGLVIILTTMMFFLKDMTTLKVKRLKKTGLCKWLPVTEIVETEKHIRINKKIYYGQYVVLEDRREEEDTVYVYKSHPVYADLHGKFMKGMKLAVYIDPNDPDNYYIDLNL